MTILNTLLWWQWLILGGIPLAIVLLYFLKLKRKPLEVPSTYLWQRTIEDLHVNTIWQRLRRNLLLLLQILLILLVMLALLRPGWRGTELTGTRFVLLIDHSASMGARDEQPSRLAEAKRRALEIVDQMRAGNSAMVIAFSDQAQVVQTYTESRRTLRRQIDKIQPTARATSIRDALGAAAGLANPGLTRLENNQVVDEALPATIYIFSDGGFKPLNDFTLGNLTPRFISIGREDAGNVGIVAFSTDRNPEAPERLQAFCSIANFANQDVKVLLELFIDGESVDLVELAVAAGEEEGWFFDLPDLDDAALKLVMHHEDVLPLDNVGYSAVNRPRPARVLLVTPGDETLRLALGTERLRELADVTIVAPDVLAQSDHQSNAAAGAFDLIIYDRCQPERLPQANTLFLGALPPGKKWSWGPEDGPPAIIDIDQVHPLTQLLNMNYVKIATGHKLTPPPGSTVLFESTIGPLLAIAPRDGYEDAVLGFPLLTTDAGSTVPNTTWPLRPSFPVFVYNAVRYLGGSRGSSGTTSIRPGAPITLYAAAGADELTVVAPDGKQTQVQRNSGSTFVFADTQTLGCYEVRSKNAKFVQRFVVNLFDVQESNIVPRPNVELGHETVDAIASAHAKRRELWKWILLLGLVILATEWFIYNRRLSL